MLTAEAVITGKSGGLAALNVRRMNHVQVGTVRVRLEEVCSDKRVSATQMGSNAPRGAITDGLVTRSIRLKSRSLALANQQLSLVSGFERCVLGRHSAQIPTDTFLFLQRSNAHMRRIMVMT